MTDTINIPRAELRGALRQLSFIRSYFHLNEYASAILEEQIEAFRARLAQQEEKPKPVAWASEYGIFYDKDSETDVPLYTAPPPKREWVGLTDEEIDEAIGFFGSPGARRDARAVEQKLKEKNK